VPRNLERLLSVSAHAAAIGNKIDSYAYKKQITFGRQVPAKFHKRLYHAPARRIKEDKNSIFLAPARQDAIGPGQGRQPARPPKRGRHSLIGTEQAPGFNLEPFGIT